MISRTVVDDACENGGGAQNQDHQGLLSIKIVLCPRKRLASMLMTTTLMKNILETSPENPQLRWRSSIFLLCFSASSKISTSGWPLKFPQGHIKFTLSQGNLQQNAQLSIFERNPRTGYLLTWQPPPSSFLGGQASSSSLPAPSRFWT